ncbi:MAG: DUF1566 domain-containing protein [Bacteroidetes bacterium]|jgi:hypothetical protein|nr:DUF1566 domain-containing protein [Bacteroidota bacterium]MBT6686144.1 DUF1566 domain-containing protein [Bacteroidota bacterium]MBT7143855.1 DUF1566 domain-containing protein [Bacteroidota bacterium]MBT7491210.1 DUF1566 domain-containing protein [Bacteroidota bacterium]
MKAKQTIFYMISFFIVLQITSGFSQTNLNYPIVDTGQEIFYDTTNEILEPIIGSAYYGQDAHYTGNVPNYQDNADGTVSDLVTGLMWSKTSDLDNDGDIDYNDKLSYAEAMAGATTFNLAGYTDWRLPTIKEMYSLKMFFGVDPSGYTGTSTAGLVPFIDTNSFDFGYGDQSAGERIIDSQLASSNLYVSTTMGGNETMFGVNYADGRIKGYPTGPQPGQTVDKQFYVMYVRGNAYGENNLQDNNDSTITDNSSSLMWTKYDDGSGMNWEDALSYAEAATIAGYSDWRLPNVKELQSIVDYTRSPATSNSAAIDSLFSCSQIIDEGGSTNYPFYWSGTTHANISTTNSGAWAAYVCFGEALGFMEQPPNSGNFTLMDVHGAGAQRSDPKVGDPNDYPYGNGPQGDVVRIFNYVRLVRDVDTSTTVYNELNLNDSKLNIYPSPAIDHITISISDNYSEISTIKIINLSGELKYSENREFSQNTTIDISNLESGIYFVLLQIEGKEAYSRKLIVL